MRRIIPQIITVKKKQYVVGLFWQPLPGSRQKLNFIEKTARSLIGGAQFFCIRSGGASQFGLGFSKKGHKKNLPVATLSVASALKDKTSTLAVFKVKQGWWLVVLRSNLILPEDDFLFEKEADAKKNFMELLDLPDWGYKIAPASWDISGTQDMELSKLVERVRPVLLQPIAKKKTFTIIFILLFLAIGGYFAKGYLFPKTPIMKKSNYKKKFVPKKIKGKKNLAEKSKLNLIKQKKEIKKVNYSWENLLDLTEHASFCQNGLRYFGHPIPGWTLFEMNCDTVELKVRYERRGGSLDFFNTAYDAYFQESKMKVEDSGNTVWLSMKLPKISKKSVKPFLQKKEIEQRLLTFAQKIKQNISISSPREVSKTPLNFDVVNFSFSSKIPVRDWAIVLSTLGAVQWEQMQWNVQNKSWNGKGIIYAIH